MSTEIITGNGTFIFIEVPNNTTFKEFTFGLHSHRLEFYNEDNYVSSRDISRFQIISTTKDITEEQTESIVEWNNVEQYYFLYPSTSWQGDITAKESLQSLIQVNGLDITKNYLILKKL